jgi:HlyD family secretion protein
VKKKYLKIGAIIIVIFIIALGLFFYFKGKSDAKEMANLEKNNLEANNTAVVEIGNIQTSITGNGNVKSKIVKELKTQNNGAVAKVYVEEGQRVDKGDIILELRNESDDISINQSSLDIFEAENRLKKLKEDAENLTIKAPFSGIVTEISGEEGDKVSSDQKYLRIIDKSVLEAVVPFNKKQVEKMKVGDKANVVVLGSYQTLEGKVTKISQQGFGGKNGGLLHNVTVEVKNPGALAEGMEVKVDINKGGFSYYAIEQINKLKWKTNKIVEFKIDGTLDNISVEQDQKVSKGDILGKISNEDYLRDIEVQEKRVRNNRLELGKKKKELDDDIIYSPIAGTVIGMNVVSGENITSDDTATKIADLDNLKITIPVDELDILKVKKGQDAIIDVSALKGKAFNGKVTDISQEGNIQNGVSTFDVTISIDEPKDLKLGMSANVKILLGSKENVLLVPVDYIDEKEDKYYIQVKNNDGETKETEVELGLVSKDFAEIVSDNLKEGDIIWKGIGY